jgi:hypothetical protein
MPLITVSGIQRYATGFEDARYIEVINLIGDGKGNDSEIRERPLRFQRQKRALLSAILFFPEGSFTNDIAVAVQQAIDGMDPQAGHASIIGVRVDEGSGESASPLFDNSALFSGKPPPCLSDFIPTHRLCTKPLFPAALDKSPIHGDNLIGYHPQRLGSLRFAKEGNLYILPVILHRLEGTNVIGIAGGEDSHIIITLITMSYHIGS